MPAGLDGNLAPLVSTERTRLLRLVADAVVRLDEHRAVLVAVDGPSGTGKSTFADELAGVLTREGKTVVRASIDSFHRPRAERYRRGQESPEGYYRDSHDLDALRHHLLEPLARGAGAFRRAVFDEPTDQPVRAVAEPVPPNAVLVFDGLFLHRPQLLDYWDLTVYLTADARREAAWQDYLTRDLPEDRALRNAEIERRVTRARRARYVEGQRLYEREAQPLGAAHLVVDNDDLARPRLVTRAAVHPPPESASREPRDRPEPELGGA